MTGKKLIRFGISLPEDLLAKFDALIRNKKYPNRSEAIRDLMRESLVRKEWQEENREVAGAVTLVYDHHQRALVNRLTDIRHDFHQTIISGQHIRLDHDNCLEVIVLRGRAREIIKLSRILRSVRGSSSES